MSANQLQVVGPIQELRELATQAYKSGLLPKSIDTIEKAITIAAMGKELGLPVMASLTGIYVVNGVPTVKSQLMLRLIYERVPGARIEVLTPPEKADTECTVVLARPGQPEQKFRFTLEDAKKAGLLGKGVWTQYPSVMLRWAAIRTGARVVFADAISGVYMEDEVDEDISKPAGDLNSRLRPEAERVAEMLSAQTAATKPLEIASPPTEFAPEESQAIVDLVDLNTRLARFPVTAPTTKEFESRMSTSPATAPSSSAFEELPPKPQADVTSKGLADFVIPFGLRQGLKLGSMSTQELVDYVAVLKERLPEAPPNLKEKIKLTIDAITRYQKTWG